MIGNHIKTRIMKVTTLSFEFDGRDEQEVTNVTKMLKELLSGASEDVSAETRTAAFKKEANPVLAGKTTSTAVPTPSEPSQPVAPTFSEPTKTAAPKKAKSKPAKAEEPAKADDETKNEAPTLKEMQHLVISSVRSGHVTHDEMASILLEFGGTSLSKVSASKFALLKQRIENYHLTR